jgi:DNA recombination protein RmuC
MSDALTHLLLVASGFVAGGALGGLGVWLYAQARTAHLQAQGRADAAQAAWLDHAQQQLRELFQVLAARALRDNTDDLAQRLQTQLGGHARQIGLMQQALERNLDHLDGHLRHLEQQRVGAYHTLTQQVDHLQHAHDALRHTTEQLRAALQAGPVRGRWGELQLRRVVELAGLSEHVSFSEQPVGRTGGRPDLVVHLPGDGHVAVDASFPFQAFLEALTASDPARRQHLAGHVRSLKDKIQELSHKRYWQEVGPGPELTILFVPTEACLAAAHEHEPGLVEFALEHQILLASPVTLLGYLKAIAYGWQHVTLSQNTRALVAQGQEVLERLGKWLGHLRRTGEKLAAAVEGYNEAVGSLQARFLPACRRWQALAALTTEWEEVEAIDASIQLPAEWPGAPPPAPGGDPAS